MHELEDFSTIWKKQSLADVSFWFTNSGKVFLQTFSPAITNLVKLPTHMF